MSKDKVNLKGTQKKLSIPIINRLCRKMTVGVRFPNIKVVGRLIGDGHHRYVAALLADRIIETDQHVLNSSVEVVEWHLVSFEDEDWDAEENIQAFNQQDAIYSDMSVEQLNELLNLN